DQVLPAGDLSILADLGLEEMELGALAGDLDLYPDEVLASVSERLGFQQAFQRALDSMGEGIPRPAAGAGPGRREDGITRCRPSQLSSSPPRRAGARPRWTRRTPRPSTTWPTRCATRPGRSTPGPRRARCSSSWRPTTSG